MKKSHLFLSIFSLSCSLLGSDWPVWRGVNQDSTTTEKVSPNADITKVVWQTELGDGYSAVSVYKGKLLTAGNSDKKDTIFCLNPKTGETIWTYSYECDKGKGYPGPRATPVTDGEFVYMLSRFGDLSCLDLKTGKKVWHKNVMKEYKAENIRWGFSGSVAVKGNNVFVNVGENGMAFNKSTGKAVWANKPGACGYSTPIFFSYKNKDYVALFGAKKFFVMEELSGKIAASIDWVTSYNINAADPIVTDNGSKIFVSSGYKSGSARLDFDGTSLTKVWENDNLKSQFATPVLKNGIVYGASGNTGKGKLVAISHKTGESKWVSKEKFGSPLLAGDKLIYLDERGSLLIINPTPDKLDILKKERVISKGKCWTMPVLANGLLYCRNDRGLLICIDVSK